MVNCVVIDDDPDIIELFSELLELSNIHVVANGHDGHDAVELYKKFKPDVLFIDLAMPKFDGEYGIEKIREFDPDAKIIVLSGNPSDDKTYLLEVLKANFVMNKPFDMRAIREAITVALLETSVSNQNS